MTRRVYIDNTVEIARGAYIAIIVGMNMGGKRQCYGCR
jgi:DNA mismatch repair ATPase MutS